MMEGPGVSSGDVPDVMDPKDLRSQEDSFPSLLERGRALRREGDWERADALFQQAAARRPERMEPLLERARLHFSRGDVGKAEALLRGACRRHPAEALPVVLLVRLLLRRDELEAAMEALEEGYRGCPAHPLLLLSEAELHLCAQDFPRAAATLEAARAAGASSSAVRAGLGRLALGEGCERLLGGQPDVAAFCFKRAADLRPREPEPTLQLGLALLALGRPRRAAAQARRALALGERDADLLWRAGCLLRDAGDGAGAAAALERARRLDPQHSGARRALADLVAARQPARALLLYAEEVAQTPADRHLWLLLGELCERLGDRRAALRCRKRGSRSNRAGT